MYGIFDEISNSTPMTSLDWHLCNDKQKIWQIYVCFCTLPEKAVPVAAVEAVKKTNRKYQK